MSRDVSVRKGLLSSKILFASTVLIKRATVMITRKQILCSIRDNTSYDDDNGDKVFHHDRLQHPYDQSSFF